MKVIILFVAILLFQSCSETIIDPKFLSPDQEIKIFLKYGFKNEINTFEKTLTKDLIQNGTITIDFWFEKEEQNRIIKKLDEINFWTLRDTIDQKPDSIMVFVQPDPGIQALIISYKNQGKSVYWFLANDYPEEYNRLNILVETILEIVQENPKYKNLPPAKGAYF